jgi:hypothetical protein
MAPGPLYHETRDARKENATRALVDNRALIILNIGAPFCIRWQRPEALPVIQQEVADAETEIASSPQSAR